MSAAARNPAEVESSFAATLRSRGILRLLVVRELRGRYAGSGAGMFWNIIHPIILVGMYILVFSRIMGAKLGDGGGGLYVVHLVSGILPWIFFSEIVTRSTGTLVENASYLKKTVIPEEVLFLGVALTSFLTHFTGLVFLTAVLAVLRYPEVPPTEFLLALALSLPVLLALGALAVGVGMILSVLHLLLRDIGQIVQIALNLLFWAVPIVYLPSIVPERLQHLLQFNPVLPYFSVIQKLYGSPDVLFNPDAFYPMLVYPFLFFLGGLHFIRKNRSEILDRL
ncbi:MAG: ABC transporter permease [Candidatus Sumerlaeia bacterium]|nr:ABC transporter permease [Candidatus Sumerlaeia bacterium]